MCFQHLAHFLYSDFFAFIISGGIGNFVDRICRGAVVDFLDFGIGYLRWPSFNIADSCIFIAVCIMVFDILVLNKQKV